MASNSGSYDMIQHGLFQYLFKSRDLYKCYQARIKPRLIEYYGTQDMEKTLVLKNRDDLKVLPEDVIDDRVFPLDSTLREQFERAFGMDLSHVKIHVGHYAEQLARNSNAMAVTRGNDIYFGAGQFAPYTTEGFQLLAHEIKHTLQFKDDSPMTYFEDIDLLEEEADLVEQEMFSKALHHMKNPDLNDQDFKSAEQYTDDSAQENIGSAQTDTLSMKGFSSRNNDALFKVTFTKSGKVHYLTRSEKEKIIDSAKTKIMDYLEEKRMILPEDEYQQLIQRYISIIEV